MDSQKVTFDDLDAKCLQNVLRFLPGEDCARLSCVSPAWHSAASSEELWRELTKNAYPAESPNTPADMNFETFREVFRDLYLKDKRVQQVWSNLKGWCENRAPKIAESLQKGATDEEISEAEEDLGVQFPLMLRFIYKCHDGQNLNYDNCLDEQHDALQLDSSVFAGLFGGYLFYNHFACTRMLPLRRVVKWTLWIRDAAGDAEEDSGQESDMQYRIVFAASYIFNKVFFVDTRDGSIHVWTHDRSHTLRAISEDPVPGLHDGVVRWMEAFAKKLMDGVYQYAPLLESDNTPAGEAGMDTRGINLFPATGSEATMALTKGVKVKASSVFSPELSLLSEVGPPTYTIAYCIKFSLVSTEEQEATSSGAPLHHCKLRSRHWVIRDADGATESKVDGEAVIGKYPDLRAGGEEFCYQSCTRQQQIQGSMEGHFMFVDMADRGGPVCHDSRPYGHKNMMFAVECPKFTVQVPDVIF